MLLANEINESGEPFAEALGYEVTLGEAYRHPDATWGHPRSLHKQRLAIDLNLFKDGRYLTDTASYEPLGTFWEAIGGSWGGRFQDGNHFSLAHGGMR
ncbi:MAG: M15 family peptidase [Deltaproteobacteria bacterium]|nr:MAG: M15 family peptidase [Deltaproteobacteria bacterium]